MKSLSLKRNLDEDTRMGTVVLYHPDGIFDLHRSKGEQQEYYITEHGTTDIYMVCTEELWDRIFEDAWEWSR